MADVQEQKIYQDLDVFGNENSDGTAKLYLDNEAIKMAFTLWLTSKRGDFLRQPTLGGVFDTLLFKQMSEEKAQMIHFSIKNAINNSFSPTIKLLDLQITPNYEQRYWEIYIKYENPFDRQIESVTIYTKDTIASTSIEYIEIDYVGNNLYNFCEIKIPSMEGQMLLYDTVKLVWMWGRYLFTLFTTADTRFDDILGICNGS